MRLTQNAAEGADRDLALSRHDRRVDVFRFAAHELHVAASLTGLFKSGRFESAFDLSKD